MDETSVHKYSTQQKLSFTMLLIFGILIIVLGFLQMRNTIYTPFVIKEADLEDPLNNALYQNDQVKLQSIDTDHDGLNDYEELQFFGTSPYLPDSDSDGIGDKKEIDNHTDPLCPQGQRCVNTQISEKSVTSTAVSPIFGIESGIGLSPTTPPPSIEGNLEALSQNPRALREMMLRSGVITKEEIDQVDDATLLQVAKSIIGQKFGQSVTASSSTPAQTTTSSP